MPVATLIHSRVVRPGHLDTFRAWADALDRAAAAAPGHAGLVRLEQAEGFHHLLHRFHSDEDLAGWRATPEYQALLDEGEAHSVGCPQAKAGDAVSFALPSEASARKWKAWLVTSLAVLPVVLVITNLTKLLFPNLGDFTSTVLTTPLLTATLTWIILPRVSRWSRFWQVQDADGNVRKQRDTG